MSQSRIRCSDCPGRDFPTLLEAVQHVMSERGTSRHVQCCVQGCSKRVLARRFRRHMRKSHKELCPWSCSACPEKFVGQSDLNNHQRNGCHGRKLGSIFFPEQRLVIEPSRNWLACVTSLASISLGKNAIETFLESVNFRDSSAVNNFITENLQLDEASRDDFSEAVDLLCQYLQRNLPACYSMNQLVKGGSVGKGTAVKDKADIDCVVFLNNLKTMKEHKRNLPETKNRLESCLEQSPYKNQITFDEQTAFAVKFNFKLRPGYLSPEFHIDLLPTFTTDQSRKQLYEEMIKCTTEDRRFYSAHFVSLRVEFVKGQLAIVKNLIRLVKYWRKTCIEDKSSVTARLPSSYPLELITIGCWEKAGKPSSFDIRAGFEAVLQQLVDNCQIHFIWYNYYDRAIAESGIKAMESSSRPFVLDPANPANNVCSASNAEGWKIVADVARMTLGRQPPKDVIFSRNWQII